MARRGTPIAINLRLLARRAAADGDKIAAIARALGLSRPTIYKYLRQKTCD